MNTKFFRVPHSSNMYVYMICGALSVNRDFISLSYFARHSLQSSPTGLGLC